MKTKLCSNCKKIKAISGFYKGKANKDGLRGECKECVKQYNKRYRKNNPEKVKANARKWRKNNVKHRSQYRNKRFKNNPNIRLNRGISSAIYLSLKGNKNNHWENLVGYTLQDLITHLEKLFKSGMTWGNYGSWHIDHRRPISKFNFKSYNDPEFKECWSLDNLQPLWWWENLIKGNR